MGFLLSFDSWTGAAFAKTPPSHVYTYTRNGLEHMHGFRHMMDAA
jgi:hypothetical protein